MPTSTNLLACNCFASRQAARAISKMYERHLSSVGLTNTQFSILVMLGDMDGASMKQMADTLVMDRTSVVRALQPLERDGLVQAAADTGDARKNVVRLSARGKARLNQAAPAWRAAQDEFEASFGKQFAAQLRSMLALER